TRREENVYLDAQGASEALFGDHMPANVLLLGAAWQAGLLPLSEQAIERAIRLNGAAVETNLAAFRWGRLAVADRTAFDREIAARSPAAQQSLEPSLGGWERREIDASGATGELKRLLEVRVPELVRYQDRAYARRYLGFVR